MTTETEKRLRADTLHPSSGPPVAVPARAAPSPGASSALALPSSCAFKVFRGVDQDGHHAENSIVRAENDIDDFLAIIAMKKDQDKRRRRTVKTMKAKPKKNAIIDIDDFLAKKDAAKPKKTMKAKKDATAKKTMKGMMKAKKSKKRKPMT